MHALILLSLFSVGLLADPSFVILNNGLRFPRVSFGLQVYDDDTAFQFTLLALQAGITNFFSSVLAGNQKGFGRAINNVSSTIPRNSLFICGSVNSGEECGNRSQCQQVTAQGCAQNLLDLNLTYLDMIMLDYPGRDCESIIGQWLAFEAMLSSGLTRSIAVSNFSPNQLDCLRNATKIIPVVNQMPYSVGHGSDPVVKDNTARNVVVQAYSPLNGGILVNDPDCIAIGKAHNKTSAQVAFRWIIQHNATFTTSASKLEYFQQDLNVFDLTLTTSEMATLDSKHLNLETF